MLIVLGLIGLVFLFTFFYFLNVWVRALASKAHVGVLTLIGMKLRHVDPGLIVEALIRLKKAGLSEIETDSIEAHFLAGGDVLNVVNALIAADKAGIPLNFKRAAAIDLGRARRLRRRAPLRQPPRQSTAPTPRRGGPPSTPWPRTASSSRPRPRVTVRANLERLVGGATEETIIARVGEGIVTTIGSSGSYANVLENPDQISKRVLEKGLDSGTAYEILSIDIADVDVGENIGAKLQADQAEADMRVAQARAEVRRAQAVAVEQEIEGPRPGDAGQGRRRPGRSAPWPWPPPCATAISACWDYYRMENLKADTDMRSNIVGEEDGTVPVDGRAHPREP